MLVATIKVSGVRAEVMSCTDIPAGLAGGQIQIEYDDSIWSGLRKAVVFKGYTTVDIITDAATIVIPPEVVSRPHVRLSVGILGTSPDGAVVIPTLWADLGIVKPATDLSGDSAAGPQLPIWAQLLHMIGDLNGLGTNAKDNLVAAVNEVLGKAGTGGSGGNANCLLTVETITIGEPSEPGNVPVTGIVLDYSSISLNAGESIMLAASVTPSNATNTAIIWETSDDSITKVENGLVTAIASGNCTITAKSAENNSIKATCSVAVAAESGGDEPGEDTEGKIMFDSIEPVKTDANIKTDGVTEDLSTAGYAYYKIPYSEGMTISTCTRVVWTGVVPPVVVIDNGVVSVPTFTNNGYISSLLNNFTVTLTGFTDSAIVYANVADGDDNTMALCYYIPGGVENAE